MIVGFGHQRTEEDKGDAKWRKNANGDSIMKAEEERRGEEWCDSSEAAIKIKATRQPDGWKITNTIQVTEEI